MMMMMIVIMNSRSHCGMLVSLQKAQSAGAKGYTPSWVRYRYGAWYLQPKLWKKHPVDEPLHNPKEPKNKEVSEAKSKSLGLVCDTLQLVT